METLPRDKVLQFLKEGFEELAIPYLEHIIYIWDEKGPEFHNVLIQLYLGRVQGLMKQYLNSLPEGKRKHLEVIKKSFPFNSFFSQVLGHLTKKWMSHLSFSAWYKDNGYWTVSDDYLKLLEKL